MILFILVFAILSCESPRRSTTLGQIESPPRCARVFVVLPMVTEEPATRHRPEVVSLLCSCSMRSHGFGMRELVRLVGTKIEELERSKECREHPEQQQVRHRYLQYVQTDIEQERHSDQLEHGDIAEEEVEKPAYRVLTRDTKIWIRVGSWTSVVSHVLGEHAAIPKRCKEPKGDLTDRIVHSPVFRDRAVHAVVGCDEQPCVEVGLYHNMCNGDNWSSTWRYLCQRPDQVRCPESDHRQSDY